MLKFNNMVYILLL